MWVFDCLYIFFFFFKHCEYIQLRKLTVCSINQHYIKLYETQSFHLQCKLQKHMSPNLHLQYNHCKNTSPAMHTAKTHVTEQLICNVHCNITSHFTCNTNCKKTRHQSFCPQFKLRHATETYFTRYFTHNMHCKNTCHQ